MYRNVPACKTPLPSRRVACGHVAVRACELACSYCPPTPRFRGTARCGDGPQLVVFFGLPPDHSTLGLITKTSILVWSWSHSVRTLMRNMWSCPDTQSEETQSFTPSVSPPFPSPFPLPFSYSFLHTLPCSVLCIFGLVVF